MSKNNKQKKKNLKTASDPLDRIKAWAVSVYVFLMLVVFVLFAPGKYFYIGNFKIAFFEIITGAFLFASLVLLIVSIIKTTGQKQKIKIKLTLFEIILLIYGTWNLISFAFSSYKKDAFFGYYGWHTGLYMQLSLIAVFFVVGRWKGKVDWLIRASSIILVVESFMVVLQRLGFDPFGFYIGMGFMDWNRRNLLGTIGNTNWLIGYEIIIIPILVWLYLETKEVWKRILWEIGNFMVISAVFLQDSSSGIVALGVILLVLIWIYAKDAKKLSRILEIVCMIFLFWSILSIFRIQLIEPEEKDTSRYYTLLWIIPVILLGIIITALYLYMKKRGSLLPKAFAYAIRIGIVSCILLGIALIISIQFSDKLWRAFGSVDAIRITDMSGSFRVLLWKQCLKHYLFESGIKEFLLGVGPDSFGYWYETKNIVIPVVGGPFMDSIFTNAHNDIITTMVNIGIPGLAIYLCVFLTMAGVTIKSIYKKTENTWAIPALMVIIGYVVNNFFSFQTVCSTPIFFIVMSLMLKNYAND